MELLTHRACIATIIASCPKTCSALVGQWLSHHSNIVMHRLHKRGCDVSITLVYCPGISQDLVGMVGGFWACMVADFAKTVGVVTYDSKFSHLLCMHYISCIHFLQGWQLWATVEMYKILSLGEQNNLHASIHKYLQIVSSQNIAIPIISDIPLNQDPLA